MSHYRIKTQVAICRTLYEIQSKHKRTFSQVKRSTIRKLLKKIYKINVSLSDISYHLTILRKNYLIRVWERYGRNQDGTYYNLPSNRSVTHKGLIYLTQCGIKIAKYLYDWAFNGVKPKRYKHPNDLQPQPNVFSRPQKTYPESPVRISDILPVIKHALI